MDALAWIQNTTFSTWIRESSWALFACLIIHTISMGFLVGTAFAMNLRLLGIAHRVPLPQFARLFPVMIYSAAIAICSGLLLLISYPAKAITNPVFYLKLTLVVSAFLLSRTLVKKFFTANFDARALPKTAQGLACLCLLLWSCGLTAGKFLAYTNKVLLLY